MNEGKPTKAKWWNRPRPQGPSPAGEGTGPTTDVTSGPAPVAPDADEPTASGGADERDLATDQHGDFELARPATRTPADTASPEGDFELARPAANGSGGQVASAEGDFELARPSGTPVAAPSTGTAAAGTADAAAAVPAGSAEAGATVPVESTGHATPAPTQPVAERPKPLHDPDPYSTPPYGEPGPWAPAPPVQHPATTPAHGTAVPTTQPPSHGLQAPLPGLSTPASAPGTPSQAPAPGAPTPTPAPAIPAQSAPPAPAAPAAPAYADAPPPTNPWQNYDPWAPATNAAGPLQQNGAAVATDRQRRRRAKKALLVGVLVVALVSGGVGGVVGAHLERNGGVGDVELPQADADPAGRAPDSVAGIAARALPSVVTLHVSGSEEQGTGTGFVLDDRGHILTNNHVVEPAGDEGEISVTFHSGDTAKATVVGRDGGYDLAVVKVTGVSGLEPLPLGNSDNVQVGDPVVAIGAPFDLAGTVTSGIISAKERPITAGGEDGDTSDVSYVDALQTDAPINPGNSGGPLLDAEARVIGINSAIRSADSGSDLDGGQAGSIGLGFAIPVNQAKRVAEELINTGRATHPVIGVTLDMDYTGDGARVGTKGSDGGPAVTKGGPGDRSGIKPGDVITEVDGQRVHSGEELIVKTRAHRPGDRLELTVERGGEKMTISLTLGSSSGD
ncbi:trypsin-like peptidase domain-containing protein [Streptomyces sp. NPDC006385]|uniref:trypsin-like peptidase domain-containing protein n=1 Tax=Streptomyces sp. NPDC006385 TaxID=3156761 RepID=UPI0033A3EBE0